jgi:hypothetical protein
MLKILNLNKQTNSWRLKEHLSSFTKLVTFQSSIIKVYLNLCVHQCLVSFFEKQHLYSPMICLADWPIVVHFVLYFLCHIWPTIVGVPLAVCVIRSDRLIGFVCPKYFMSDRKVSTIIVKVGVVLTFTFIMFSLYFVINGIQFHLLF